jgi:hypothetical protein
VHVIAKVKFPVSVSGQSAYDAVTFTRRHFMEVHCPKGVFTGCRQHVRYLTVSNTTQEYVFLFCIPGIVFKFYGRGNNAFGKIKNEL